MIIDSHTHIDRAHGKDWTAEMLIAGMQDAGIAHSIVIANDITEAPLDKVLSVTKPHKEFSVVGNMEYHRLGEGWIEKLIGHLENNDIKGVKLYPGYENYYPYDEKFKPLFEYCQKNGHPIMVHTGPMLTGCEGYLDQAHPLHIDRIATEYPKLKIVIAHLGNPWFYDTVAVMWKNPNVYTDISALFDEFKSLRKEEKEFNLKRLTDVHTFMGGFSRFIFGTDWPLYSQKEYVEFAKQIEMSDIDKELFFEGNAKKIFNLEF